MCDHLCKICRRYAHVSDCPQVRAAFPIRGEGKQPKVTVAGHWTARTGGVRPKIVVRGGVQMCSQCLNAARAPGYHLCVECRRIYRREYARQWRKVNLADGKTARGEKRKREV